MKGYGWFGLALLVFSEYFLFRNVEPFVTWFYCFAWWSYILLADNLLLWLRGSSLLVGRRREVLVMLPLSVLVWLLFEAFNLVVRNWAYEGLPGQLWLRWPGYALAFATVLPATFVTSDLIHFWLFRGRGGPPASASELLPEKPPTGPSPLFFAIGVLLTAAPLLWPRIFFPAIWLGPIFLLDPALEKLGIRSLSLSISSGRRERVWSLLMGGFACGLMWEFWNFWASSRWIYTIPFFGNWKLFEMPVLGFLGFPPFALECWILYHLLSGVERRLRSGPGRAAFWLGIGICWTILFICIDSRTVIRFADHLPRSIVPWGSG